QCGSWLACDAGGPVYQVPPIMHNPCALIPVYNHEAAVPAVVHSVLKSGLPCLLVDDGSSPACAAVLAHLAT
ncbi:glycosyltransferase, partial [Klebsiella pneumoniae]|uniref:glycosyltransferase n=1 Tax=Klebsiella pneumoniae TaxID=573 RepID=UPI0019530181